MEKIREYPKNRIKTIDFYGSKRTWYREFEKLFIYANALGCDICVDCLAGSGILSLLAARTGLYKAVQMNEISYLVVNYHRVMKDEIAFHKFLMFLEEYEWLVKEDFNFVKEMQEKFTKSRIQVRNINSKKAAIFYLIQYYSYNAQGGFVDKRKGVKDYKNALRNTHNLYKNIEITQYHYKKILKANMNQENCLIIIDCPYVTSERRQKKSYFVEFTERQHRYMLQELTQQEIKAKIVICGYDNNLYNNYFLRYNVKNKETWHCIKLLRAGSRKEGAEAKETWWVNFDIDSFVQNNINLFRKIY